MARSDPGLTYRVYTVDEIPKSRQRRADRAPSPWLPLRRAALAVAVAFRGWALSSRSRPSIAEAMRDPLEAFFVALRHVVSAVDGRKVGVGFAVGLVTILLLLFGVLALATLADGPVPARRSGSSTTPPGEPPAEVFIP